MGLDLAVVGDGREGWMQRRTGDAVMGVFCGCRTLGSRDGMWGGGLLGEEWVREFGWLEDERVGC